MRQHSNSHEGQGQTTRARVLLLKSSQQMLQVVAMLIECIPWDTLYFNFFIGVYIYIYMAITLHLALNPLYNWGEWGEQGPALQQTLSRVIPSLTATQHAFNMASTSIRTSIATGAGALGMCGGIIDSGYFNPEQANSEAFLITAFTPGGHHGSPTFSGFAACKLVPVTGMAPALYIDVLCANVRGVARYIMQKIICEIGLTLGKENLISAIQLSSLTYVIGYYFHKWGFRFYNTSNGIFKGDDAVNRAVLTLPRISADLEYQHDLDDLIINSTREWEKIREAVSVAPGGPNLLKQLAEQQRLASASTNARRATLLTRLGIMKKIININKSIHQHLAGIQHFMETAANYSVAKPGFHIYNLRGQERQEAQIAAVDPAGEGWTMFLPFQSTADNSLNYPTISTQCGSGQGGKRRRRKRRKSRRKKKGTRKRALKKRRRRRKKTRRRRRRRRQRGCTRR